MDEELLELIRKIVYDVTGRTAVTYDTDFVRDLGLTSFDIINMVCAFEAHYNAEIPTRDIWQLHTVQDVIEYMKKQENA